MTGGLARGGGVHAREYFAGWLGPEHTWSKVTAIITVVVLALLFLVRVTLPGGGEFYYHAQRIQAGVFDRALRWLH